MTEAKANKIDSFFRDVVDHDKDPGDKWKMGNRLSEVRKRRPKGSKSVKLDTSKLTDKEREEVEVGLVLRRMPFEVNQELRELFISKRQVKDGFGNVRSEEYWENDNLNRFIFEKCMWMWLGTYNMWVEAGDEDAVKMYQKGYAESGANLPQIKPGDDIRLDGHLTEEIKRHLLDRFTAIKTKCIEASGEYEQAEKDNESRLRKNSASG